MYIVIVYIAIGCYYRFKVESTAEKNETDRLLEKAFRRQIFAYLTVFIISWGVAPVLAAYNYYSTDTPTPGYYFIWLCLSATTPLAGFLNAVVYGISRNALFLSRQRLLRPLLYLLCCLGCGEEVKWVTSSSSRQRSRLWTHTNHIVEEQDRLVRESQISPSWSGTSGDDKEDSSSHGYSGADDPPYYNVN